MLSIIAFIHVSLMILSQFAIGVRSCFQLIATIDNKRIGKLEFVFY